MRHLGCTCYVRWYIVVACLSYCLDLFVKCEALVCSFLRILIGIDSFVNFYKLDLVIICSSVLHSSSSSLRILSLMMPESALSLDD
jgi:hypothetical protein